MPKLLNTLDELPSEVQTPAYKVDEHGIGIVHLGLGAFHRAHQAFYTDLAMSASGGDWRILGVSLRDSQIPRKVNAQNGLYTVITRDGRHDCARVIGSISSALSGSQSASALLEVMCSPNTHIVSVTVTEKGYGINRTHGGIDRSNPMIQHDLEHQDKPTGVIGFIVKALELRQSRGIPAFTILCCDNLPNNGTFVKHGVLDFASTVNSHTARWIEHNARFPSTMVDRITPAQSPETCALAESIVGRTDLLAIGTEPFHQWIIEDDFSMGRPDWAAVGAILTNNVAPFEAMKLRMLNGAHSLLAYSGVLAGHAFVRDAMQDQSLVTLVTRYMLSAAQTLAPIPSIDFDTYADELIRRFSNPAIAHATIQIAADGSQKMPQRVFEPALESLEKKLSIRPFAFATAMWMFFCKQVRNHQMTYLVADPISTSLIEAANEKSISEIIAAFGDIPGLLPAGLTSSELWNSELNDVLTRLHRSGVRHTLDAEVVQN